MNKANQEALLHATNIGLIDIRQSEINYYTHLYSSFGTQAALIGGFTYSVFTQNEDVMIYQKVGATKFLSYYSV